jgi:hypothetical protein
MINYSAEWTTNRWLKKRGITGQDLESHPQISDVIMLCRWRDDLWEIATASERAFWSSQWDWCYHKRYPLKKKQLTKLEEITILVSDRHMTQMQTLAFNRQLIKSFRKATVS